MKILSAILFAILAVTFTPAAQARNCNTCRAMSCSCGICSMCKEGDARKACERRHEECSADRQDKEKGDSSDSHADEGDEDSSDND